MIAIAIKFPSGRFHSTPWGHHVNEGNPEWPPSPWRLLRSLVATWKRKLDDEPGFETDAMRGLLAKLALPPDFFLPPASTAHSRHYMPWDKDWKADQPEKAKTKVFDAFVAMDRSAELIVRWTDATLNAEESRLLDALLTHLVYLGRSESWAAARLLREPEAIACVPNCVPLNGREAAGDQEPLRVLCPDPQTMFANQHTPKYSATVGKAEGKEAVDSPLYDPDWHLCLETLELHNKRWSDPPGSRWVMYLRRADCFEVKPARRVVRTQCAISVARYVLDGPVLPLVTETLAVADKVRVTLMGIFKRLKLRERYGRKIPERPDCQPRSPVFSGKGEHGKPLQGHNHTYYLPTDEDGDGRIDHVTLCAEMGFGVDDPLEISALDQFRRLVVGEGEPLNLLLVGLGQPGDFRIGLFAESLAWVSATPFLATRYPKPRGRKRDRPELLGLANARAFTRQVLREELLRLRARRSDAVEAETIEDLIDENGVFNIRPDRWARLATGATHRPIHFRRFRRKKSDDGGRRAAGAFRIVFREPVRGPICLGHSSHFGLGLFVPEES